MSFDLTGFKKKSVHSKKIKSQRRKQETTK